MKQKGFVVADAQFAADLSAGAGGRAGLEEIVDDLDRAFDGDEALGFGAEEGGDGRDAVGVFEGVADGGAVAGVAAEEGGVGAVERGDDLGPAVGREHVAREECGGGVRHGVVGVDHVEGVIAGDLGEFHGQRQGVVGVL